MSDEDIADISYKNYFVLYLFKKCDKIHNFMHYVDNILVITMLPRKEQNCTKLLTIIILQFDDNKDITWLAMLFV